MAQVNTARPSDLATRAALATVAVVLLRADSCGETALDTEPVCPRGDAVALAVRPGHCELIPARCVNARTSLSRDATRLDVYYYNTEGVDVCPLWADSESLSWVELKPIDGLVALCLNDDAPPGEVHELSFRFARRSEPGASACSGDERLIELTVASEWDVSLAADRDREVLGESILLTPSVSGTPPGGHEPFTWKWTHLDDTCSRPTASRARAVFAGASTGAREVEQSATPTSEGPVAVQPSSAGCYLFEAITRPNVDNPSVRVERSDSVIVRFVDGPVAAIDFEPDQFRYEARGVTVDGSASRSAGRPIVDWTWQVEGTNGSGWESVDVVADGPRCTIPVVLHVEGYRITLTTVDEIGRVDSTTVMIDVRFH